MPSFAGPLMRFMLFELLRSTISVFDCPLPSHLFDDEEVEAALAADAEDAEPEAADAEAASTPPRLARGLLKQVFGKIAPRELL